MTVAGEVARDAGLETGWIELARPGGSMRCYRARPKEPVPVPGLIVLHEAFGMVEHILDVTRRLANVGYCAVAPDLYWREAAPDPADRTAVFDAMFKLHDRSTLSDLDAAAKHLREREATTGKVGCIGFCSGGRQTVLVACSSESVDAAIACWGGYVKSATAEARTTPSRPVPVIELAPTLHCPIFVVVGEEDQNPSPEVASELCAELERSGQPVRLKVFEGAGHAFFADYRPTYREAPAFELWTDVVQFFDRWLG
ncbi:MAG: dienelactone hydrolase family protein [Candidatus Dormibacteraceae bacterium]